METAMIVQEMKFYTKHPYILAPPTSFDLKLPVLPPKMGFRALLSFLLSANIFIAFVPGVSTQDTPSNLSCKPYIPYGPNAGKPTGQINFNVRFPLPLLSPQ